MKKKIEKGMSILDLAEALQSGWSEKDLTKELHRIDIEASKEEGKMFGKCESCGQKTTLVEDVGLCGPCCFGEADSVNGNW